MRYTINSYDEYATINLLYISISIFVIAPFKFFRSMVSVKNNGEMS